MAFSLQDAIAALVANQGGQSPYQRMPQDSGAAPSILSAIGGMQQGGPQMPAQANFAPQAPAYQPQPQTAPQAAGGGAMGGIGGGIGDLIGNLLMPGRAGRNQTIQYLQSQGMDEGTAALLAGDKDLLRSYLGQRVVGGKPSQFDERARAATQYGLDPNSDEGRNFILTGDVPEPPNMRENFGLNPIYGKDADGNLVVMQPSKQGGLVQADLPPGVTLQPGTDRIDLGTAWGITDRSGTVISVVPKDLSGAERQKQFGKAQGEAAFDLPRVVENANQTLKVIDDLRKHPGRQGSTGFVQGRLPAYSGDTQDFQIMLAQAKGKTFLEAYNTLKGGGQITEVEGQKAEEAIARLNRAQSDEAFMTALDDFESVIRIGLDRARKQAGITEQSAPSQGGASKPLSEMSDEELEAIINGQ